MGAATAMVAMSARPAFADAGIPMLWLIWPAAWVMLVPVIGLEAVVARRILKTTWASSLQVSAVANVISTLAGIPATWLALVVIEVLYGTVVNILPSGGTLQRVVGMAGLPLMAPWIGPTEEWRNSWAIPAAAMWLCLPFFLVSVRIEAWAVERWVPVSSAPFVKAWSRTANMLSYGMFEVLLAGLLGFCLLTRNG